MLTKYISKGLLPHANDGLPNHPPGNNPREDSNTPNGNGGRNGSNPAAGGNPGSLGLSLERVDDGSDWQQEGGLGCSTTPGVPASAAWLLLPLVAGFRRRS